MININDLLIAKKNLKSSIPYRNILNSNGELDRAVIQNGNNTIFVVWQLWGKDDHNDENILDERTQKLAEMMSSNFDSKYEFTYDFIRNEVKYEFENVKCEDGLDNAQKIQDIRYKKFTTELPIFENKIYFSLCYTPTNGINNKTVELISENHIDELYTAVTFCQSYLQLSGFEYELLKDKKLITYLYNTVTNDFTEKIELQEPDGDLNTAFASVVDIWQSTVPLKINDNITQCIPLTYFPSKRTWNKTFTNMFVDFSTTVFPIRIIAKYRPNSTKEGEDILYKRKRTLRSHQFRATFSSMVSSGIKNEQFSEDEIDLSVIRGIAGVDNALTHQDEDNISNGNFSFTILLSCPWRNEELLDEYKKNIVNILANLGIKATDNKSIRLSNTAMYYASFIGTSYTFKDNIRLSLADNVASTFLVSSTTNNYTSPFLEKIVHSTIPHLIGIKTDGSLFKASLCGSVDTGHTLLAGETGGGKSVCLSYMANEWLKYENTRVVFFDMGLSCLKTIYGNHGKLYYPGVDSTAFCPFKNAKDRPEAILNFIEAIAVGNGFNLTPAERKKINDTIDILPYGEEDFETFYALYGGTTGDTQLTQALLQYINIYGHYFNSSDDSFRDLPRVVGIELSKLLTNQTNALIYPSLVYLFDSLEEYFIPEQPTLLILDEAWAYLKNNFFAGYIEKWLKQLRKKNVFVILATQQLADLIDSPLKSTIIENTHTQIYLANEKANLPIFKEYYKALGFDENNINQIANLPRYAMLFVQEGSFTPITWKIGDELQYITRDRRKEIELENEIKL